MNFKRTGKFLLRKLNGNRLRRAQYPHIKKLLSNLRRNGTLSHYPFKDCKPLMSDFSFFKKSDILWLDFYYSIYKKASIEFISVPMYYFIETCLNNRLLMYGLKEKNFYNQFINCPTPKALVRKINGFLYDMGYNRLSETQALKILKNNDKFLIKPSVESGGGSSITLFERKNGEWTNGKVTLDATFLRKYEKDFVIQEFVRQHEFFAQFNPSSNNTIRIFLYRSIVDDNINILHCLLRIGSKGSFLDHDSHGGVVLAIDHNDHFSSHAIDIYGNKYQAVNDIVFSLAPPVPFMKEIKNQAIQIAEKIYYGRLLALDFTVDYGGQPLLLEINCWRNGISQYQMHNGTLFRQFTREILDYCEKKSPSHVLLI